MASSYDHVVKESDLEANEVEDLIDGNKSTSKRIILPAGIIASTTHINQEPVKSRFYPGDKVLFKEDVKLDDWMPMFGTGTVLKPAEGSEMDKSEDKGAEKEFHVHWEFTRRITLTQRPTVSLVDRVLLRGQMVENYKREVGTVVDDEICASVVINGTDKIVKNVPLSRLRPILPWVHGQKVLLEGWVGAITSIKRNVWFKTDSGSVFSLVADDLDGFSRVRYWFLGEAWPGRRLQIPKKPFKMAKWVSAPRKFFSNWLPLARYYSKSPATILRTEVIQMEIKWLQVAPGYPEYIRPLSSTVSPAQLSELIVIGPPSTETTGIDSVRKLQILPNDNITKYKYWLEFPCQKSGADADSRDVVDCSYTTETQVKVLLRHNVVTVEWEDGTLEKIPAIEIPKISPTVDDGEFLVGLTVSPIEKKNTDGDKYGIVMASMQLAKSRSRKVNVRWMVEGKDPEDEKVSIFDIRPHQHYSLYQRGTIVFPRVSATSLFVSAVVVDLNLNAGRMVVKTSNDHIQFEVYPHQVIAVQTRCYWNEYVKKWILDYMVPPTYQLDLEFNPVNKLVDVCDQKWDVLSENTNNPPSEDSSISTIWDEAPFELLGFAPETHRYHKCPKSQRFGKGFAQAVEREMRILKEKGNVAKGIWVRCYENRMDLLSVLMVGPAKTPYENGLFLFDIQLPTDFPVSRPSVHYVSYTQEIHPLMSFDGNVCVSQISWSPSDNAESQISHFLGKLQSVIFTPTPFFAHPPTKSEENTEAGQIKARMYNQNVFVRVLDSLWNMLQKPHAPWERTIRNHFATTMPEKCQSMEKWILNDHYALDSEYELPSYPLLPIPDGLQLSVLKRVEKFKRLLNDGSTIQESHSVTDATPDSESHEVPIEEQDPQMIGARLLTPMAEMTEPSSTSTFGGKLSNLDVPMDTDDEAHVSLDSLKKASEGVL